MRDDSLMNVLEAIRDAADDAGLLSTNVDALCLATGYSRATVKRAIAGLAGLDIIDIEAKRGPGGGYRIGLRNRQNWAQKPEPNLSPIRDYAMPLENFGSGGLRPLEPEPNSLAARPEPNLSPIRAQGSWVPPDLPDDVRKRGAEFFKEVRLGLLPNKPKAEKSKGVNELEPLPRSPE